MCLSGAVCALLAASIYARVISAPFVYDDVVIRRSSLLHVAEPSGLLEIVQAKVPRKLGLISFALNFLWGGLDPRGYHLVNIALHAANGALLFSLSLLVLSRVRAGGATEDRHAALAGAAVWLAHPVHTQAVSYVYQRYTLLCAAFYLACLILYLKARLATGRGRLLYAAGAGLTGLLALGSKENAGSLPLFLALFEALLIRRGRPRLDRGFALVVLAAVLLLGAIAWLYLGPDFVAMIARDSVRRGFTPGQRVLTELRVAVYYLTLLLDPRPSRLNLDYDFPLSFSLLRPPTTLLCLLLLLGGLALAAHQWRARPLLSLALLWYLGQLVIESSFIPLDLVYEHRLYLPSTLPVALTVAWLWQRVRWPLAHRVVAVAAWVGLWGSWGLERNLVWQDPIALFEDNARKSPNKARVQGNLGKAYLDRGRHQDARRAFERAVQLDPGLAGAYINLAVIYLDHLQDPVRARSMLLEALRREPANAGALVNLGVIELRLRRPAEAVPHLEKALELEPSRAEALYNLGAARFNLGDDAGAIEVLAKGIGYWPENAGLYALMGASYLEKGDPARAERALREALRRDPDLPLARSGLERLRRARGALPAQPRP